MHGLRALDGAAAHLDRKRAARHSLHTPRRQAHTLATEVPSLLLAPAMPGHLPLTSSVLAPLLAICSTADGQRVMAAASTGAFFAKGGGHGGRGGSAVVSAAAAAMSPATELFTATRSYPNNRGEVEGARGVVWGILARVVDAAHQVAKRLAGLKVRWLACVRRSRGRSGRGCACAWWCVCAASERRCRPPPPAHPCIHAKQAPGVPAGAGREVLLAWLAAAAAANEARTQGGEYSAHRHLGGAPDGPMLNLTAAVLRLTKPFVAGYLAQSPKFADLFARHLSPGYYTSHAPRLGGASREPTLSGQRGVAASAPAAGAAAAASSSSSSSGIAPDPAAASGAASFICEVFFLAQRFMHVGLLPAVNRCADLAECGGIRCPDGTMLVASCRHESALAGLTRTALATAAPWLCRTYAHTGTPRSTPRCWTSCVRARRTTATTAAAAAAACAPHRPSCTCMLT
jgi:hypothetical protein